MQERTAFIDFETRSPVNLKKAGAEAYAQHPETDVLVLQRAHGEGQPVEWWPHQPEPADLYEHIAAGGKVVAHNAPFELAIWRHVMQRKYGAPELKAEQCDCTMARALAMGYPGALDKVAEALGLDVRKDHEGHRLMLQLCKPKLGKDGVWRYDDDPEKLRRLAQYCARDVDVERELWKRLRPLTDDEHRTWVLDHKINNRGVLIDISGARAALDVVTAEKRNLNWRVAKATGGAVATAGAVQALIDWLALEGVYAPNMAKSTVAGLLKSDDVANESLAREVLEIRKLASKASTSKLTAALASVGPDNRARGLFQFHAATTGRWGGRRIQTQNLPRPPKGFGVGDAEDVIAWCSHPKGPAAIRLQYGSPIDAVSWALRSFIVAGPGRRFVQADFANIEGRVLAWLAGEQWKLDAFRAFDAGTGSDLYKLAYSRSFGVAVNAITDDQRQIGKVQELALGYQGGVNAFRSMATNYGITVLEAGVEKAQGATATLTEREADEIKVAWREAHPATVTFWYRIQDAALDAVASPMRVVDVGRIAFMMHDDGNLYLRLPTKRYLCYPRAHIERYGEGGEKLYRPRLAFWSVNSRTRKWGLEHTYGGKLAENATQATARDILRDAMFAAETANYPTVMHVHDELLTEPLDGHGSLAEFKRVITTASPWAGGLPVAADGWEGARYHK